MVRYKVVRNSKNIFGRDTFKSKKEAREAIYFTNKGARFLKQKSRAKGAKIVLVKR